jgi:hypothetical protein
MYHGTLMCVKGFLLGWVSSYKIGVKEVKFLEYNSLQNYLVDVFGTILSHYDLKGNMSKFGRMSRDWVIWDLKYGFFIKITIDGKEALRDESRLLSPPSFVLKWPIHHAAWEQTI